MPKSTFAALVILSLAATGAAADPGDAQHPIPLHMARGTDTIVIRGVLTQGHDCCNYTFKARAGQTFYFTETGATVRIGLGYPNGDGIDPGLPSPTPLPQSGTYSFSISPDLMAEGAFGRFTVKIRIPPPR